MDEDQDNPKESKVDAPHMKYCLIEDLNHSITLPDDCMYIALNISASYKLDKLGIDYLLLEDFYKKRKISGDVDAYLYSQMDWFKTFDSF